MWSDACQKAFEKLKVAVSSKSILRLLDFDKPFEVQTDASIEPLVVCLCKIGTFWLSKLEN